MILLFDFIVQSLLLINQIGSNGAKLVPAELPHYWRHVTAVRTALRMDKVMSIDENHAKASALHELQIVHSIDSKPKSSVAGDRLTTLRRHSLLQLL